MMSYPLYPLVFYLRPCQPVTRGVIISLHYTLLSWYSVWVCVSVCIRQLCQREGNSGSGFFQFMALESQTIELSDLITKFYFPNYHSKIHASDRLKVDLMHLGN